MKLGIFFWLIVILWFFFGIFPYSPMEGNRFKPVVGNTLLLVLVLLLGWSVYGPILHR